MLNAESMQRSAHSRASMRLIENESFLSEVAKQGIALDGRYAEPRTLGYQNDHWFAVPMPSDVRQRQHVIAGALGLFADEVPVWIWRRGGAWSFANDDPSGQATEAIFRLIGVENGWWAGTLRSDGGEKGLLFALSFLNSLTAINVWQDLFIVPDGCGFIIHFDHHDQIILECRDQHVRESIDERYLAELQRVGISVDDH